MAGVLAEIDSMLDGPRRALSKADMTRQARKIENPLLPFCHVRQQLVDEFVVASRELIELQSQQTQGVIDGDPDFARFDDLIHMARDKKDSAKYALISHVEEHHC